MCSHGRWGTYHKTGDIRVELQGEAENPIPGFTMDDCLPVFRDSLERMVIWSSGSDLSPLEGKAVRLRFE